MKVPKVTSIVLVVVISLSLLNFVLKYYAYFFLLDTKKNSLTEETGEIPHPHELYVPLLTFIPTKSSVVIYPWVLVTSGFIELNIFGLLLSLVLIFYLGKYIENMWGSKEYSRFVVITTVLSNLSVYLYYRFKGLFVTFTEPPPVVLSTTGICIGLLIALKQRIGNHYLILFKGNLRIKVKFLPILVFILTFLLQLIDEEFKIYFLLTTFGTIISWTYLRFYKSGTNDSKSYLLPFYGKNKKNLEFIHIDNGSIKGDRSELFSFYTFFPYPFSSIVKILSLLVFNYFVKLGFFNPKDFGSDEDENDYVQEDINNLQSHFVGLSTLKGAGTVTTVPQASATLHKIWNWLSSSSNNTTPIKSSMDKRRKMALRELA